MEGKAEREEGKERIRGGRDRESRGGWDKIKKKMKGQRE